MADISYTRTTWADGAEGGTAIDATKLNNIEQGIVDAVAAIGPNDTTEDGTLKAQIDNINSSMGELIVIETQNITTNGSDYAFFTPKSGYMLIHAEETVWNSHAVIAISNAASANAIFFKQPVSAGVIQFILVFLKQ